MTHPTLATTCNLLMTYHPNDHKNNSGQAMGLTRSFDLAIMELYDQTKPLKGMRLCFGWENVYT